MKNKLNFASSLLFAIFFGFITTQAYAANAEKVNWQVVKGDLVEYHQLGLPDPIVIYVYNSSGHLVEIINTKGKFDSTTLEAVTKKLSNIQTNDNPVASNLDKTNESLKRFLFNQGINITELVSSKAKYTVILVEWNVKDGPCQSCIDFKQTINKVATRSTDLFHLAAISLGSDLLKFEHKN